MSKDPVPSRQFRFVAALFELLEGRRSVRSTVNEMQQALRGEDLALDHFLDGLESRSVEEWEGNLAATSARVRATSEAQARGATEIDGTGQQPLAEVVLHPSSRPGATLPERNDQPAGPAGRAPRDYSAAFSAVAGRGAADAERVAAERTRVAREIKRLMGIRSPRQRAEAIVASRRPATRSPLMVEGLLEEACRVRGASPRLALELTEAAVLASHRTHPRHGRACVWRLQKRAEAHRANALRLLGELPAADAAWRRIAEHLAAEPIDVPDEEAELRSLEASLRIDLRQFERAEGLLKRAEGLYREVEDLVGVARVLMQRGCSAIYAGNPAKATDLERQAAKLLNPELEPRLYVMSRHNLADSLLDLGRAAEAAPLLRERPDLLARVEDPTVHLRHRWIEARIASSTGQESHAERLYLDVRNGWLSHDRPYEAALATLDLAEMDLARGDWSQVKRRAALVMPLFEVRGVHQEAKAALDLFRQAACAERLTIEFLARLRYYLRFAPRDRRLRFDPASNPAGG